MRLFNFRSKQDKIETLSREIAEVQYQNEVIIGQNAELGKLQFVNGIIGVATLAILTAILWFTFKSLNNE
jgi:hypothetical protein